MSNKQDGERAWEVMVETGKLCLDGLLTAVKAGDEEAARALLALVAECADSMRRWLDGGAQ